MKTLTVKEMKKPYAHHKQFLSIMEESDPNAVRSLQVQRATDRVTTCYRLLYQEKQASVQLSLDQLFKKV
jgi:hypothetical protein